MIWGERRRVSEISSNDESCSTDPGTLVVFLEKLVYRVRFPTFMAELPDWRRVWINYCFCFVVSLTNFLGPGDSQRKGCGQSQSQTIRPSESPRHPQAVLFEELADGRYTAKETSVRQHSEAGRAALQKYHFPRDVTA